MNSYKDRSDLELITLLQAGDHLAFETIYRRYARPLYKYARKSISVPEDCEEIVQDIFVSLWDRHESLRHVTVLNAYLYRTVKYKIIRYVYHSNVKRKYAEHFKLFEAIYEAGVDAKMDTSRITSFIEKGLSSLPDRCQYAFKLRLTKNLSNQDIAKVMNIKKRTVENYMVTAVKHLRALPKPSFLD